MPEKFLASQAQDSPGSAGAAASPRISALAAVLHYLATFSQAVSLQRGDLRPLADRVAASGLYAAGFPSRREARPSTAAERLPHPASDPPAAGGPQGRHQLITHALTCVTRHLTQTAPTSGGVPAPQPLLPAGDAASHIAASAELLDGLLALQSALGGVELTAALPRAVSAAVDPQVRLRRCLCCPDSATVRSWGCTLLSDSCHILWHPPVAYSLLDLLSQS